MNIVNSFKRAPVRGALFICLLFLSACADGAIEGEAVRVRQVIDGDTIVLQNRDKVRFLGINTPELGHGERADEPLANQARLFVSRRIEGRDVQLRYERSRKDRYGRRLAEVWTPAGESLPVKLLEQGLGFAIAIGEENFGYLDSYLQAESLARTAGKGVWSEDYFAPVTAKSAVDMRRRGYQRVRGTVKRVSRSRNNQTLHLEGDFRILISHAAWDKNFTGKPQQYQGQFVEARGWIFKSHGVTGMKVYHPAMLETPQ